MNDDDAATLIVLLDRHYAEGDGTRKNANYMRSYARLLGHRRGERLRILELGVSSGASLLIWRDYLPHATIVGLDIAEPPPRILGQDRIHFIQGSQDDPAALDRAAAAAGGRFDLIIDDASHIGYLTKRSLQYLFPRLLVPGGCYVIEDFGTGFLAAYPDGQDFLVPDCNDAVPGTVEFHSSQHGMVGVVKQLVDHMMQELSTGSRSFLAIERLTVETNIVFIEKSRRPGGPLPESLHTGAALAAATVARQAERVTTLEQELREIVQGHAERIARLEAVLNRVLRGLTPLRWVSRLIGHPRRNG